MTSESTSPSPNASADSRAPAPTLAATASAKDRALALLGVLLAALTLALAAYLTQRSGELERRLAQEHADALARDQRDADLDRRLGELERQWAQAQNDADVATVPISDTELRRRREALALLDVERLVEQTQLELRMGAATSVAIDALAAADARLGRLASATALRVQAALRHDLGRLKAAPDIDRGALAARLDPLLSAVDGWHLSADPLHTGLRPSGGATPAPASALSPPVDSFGARVRAWIESEFGDLLRIREVSTPEALLLSPAQQQLVRERFRLGVLDLRQAVLARDERMIRAEEAALEDLLVRYFDPHQAGVAMALAQLRATAAATAAGAPLSLEETLSALRAARGAVARADNG